MTTIPVSNLPQLEVDASLYRGDDQLLRIKLTENGQPLSSGMRDALADAFVVWRSDFRQRADGTLLFTVSGIVFDPASDSVLLDLTSSNTAKLTPSCVADLQVSWPDSSGRIRRRTLATITVSTTRDVTTSG